MKRFAVLLLLLLLATACTLPLPSGHVILLAVSNTPRPTDTATSTATVTPTASPTATYTPTVVITLTPTPVPNVVYPRIVRLYTNEQKYEHGAMVASVGKAICYRLNDVYLETEDGEGGTYWGDGTLLNLCLKGMGVAG